jgi:hypothetical protein
MNVIEGESLFCELFRKHEKLQCQALQLYTGRKVGCVALVKKPAFPINTTCCLKHQHLVAPGMFLIIPQETFFVALQSNSTKAGCFCQEKSTECGILLPGTHCDYRNHDLKTLNDIWEDICINFKGKGKSTPRRLQ